MDIKKAKYLLPNSLTMASIFAGLNSIYLSLTASSPREMSIAAWLIVAAMICDGLDGRVARATQTESELGIQLDSLADSISFGVAPAFLLFSWGMEPLGFWGIVFAFAFAASAVLRLARYNVMANQHQGVMRYFLGLPTPLAAGAVISIVMAHLAMTGKMTTGATFSVAAMSLLLGGLMVSNIRYRTFKDINFRGQTALGLVALATLSVGMGVVFRPSVAFFMLMVLYILVGIVGGVVDFSKALLGEDITYDDLDYDEDYLPAEARSEDER